MGLLPADIRQERAEVSPCGGRKPVGFSSLRGTAPRFWPRNQRHGRQNTVMWRLCFPCGRAMPPHGGILPAGNDAGLGKDE
ncbi:MAG: hypothetical protein LBK61_12180 [Spirochaetaceae bacterium]|nr:hypothetical protein [Spirochaetaceae bacterium]